MHSNRYTIIYAIVFTSVIAILLAAAATGLRPLQEANEALAKKKAILQSVMEINEETVESDYSSYIQEFVVNMEGDEISDVAAFDIDITKEAKKEDSERLLPIYIFDNQGQKNYIVPIQGSGLWGPISAYLALEEDLSTISGVVFDHEAETPGLGAEITKEGFQEQYVGKQLFDMTGAFVSVAVLKGTGNDIEGKPHIVDGIAGATITANGVTDMFADELKNYTTYFQKINS